MSTTINKKMRMRIIASYAKKKREKSKKKAREKQKKTMAKCNLNIT